MLESIHLFVEVLDRFFRNVCELDLVFNFYKVPFPHKLSSLPLQFKVYAILDEMFLGGELQEMSREKILARLEYLEKLD